MAQDREAHESARRTTLAARLDLRGIRRGSFPLGALVCLVIARGWARGRLALPATALVWFGCVLLLLRGGAGVIDDLTRTTGLLVNGITWLSTRDTTGTADFRWSSWTIDAYFLAGGMIFGLLALRYRAASALTTTHVLPAVVRW